MKAFEEQGGIAFFLIYFTAEDRYYYLRLCELLVFWDRANEGGRKSFRTDELNPAYFFVSGRNHVSVPSLDMLQMDLDDR